MSTDYESVSTTPTLLRNAAYVIGEYMDSLEARGRECEIEYGTARKVRDALYDAAKHTESKSVPIREVELWLRFAEKWAHNAEREGELGEAKGHRTWAEVFEEHLAKRTAWERHEAAVDSVMFQDDSWDPDAGDTEHQSKDLGVAEIWRFRDWGETARAEMPKEWSDGDQGLLDRVNRLLRDDETAEEATECKSKVQDHGVIAWLRQVAEGAEDADDSDAATSAANILESFGWPTEMECRLVTQLEPDEIKWLIGAVGSAPADIYYSEASRRVRAKLEAMDCGSSTGEGQS